MDRNSGMSSAWMVYANRFLQETLPAFMPGMNLHCVSAR